jgi:hypothetical protein
LDEEALEAGRIFRQVAQQVLDMRQDPRAGWLVQNSKDYSRLINQNKSPSKGACRLAAEPASEEVGPADIVRLGFSRSLGSDCVHDALPG